MEQNTNQDNQSGAGDGGNPDPAGAAAQPPKAQPPKAQPPKAKLPKKLIMQSLYGFYDDAGKFMSWVEGQIVDDVEHIKLLIERKAPAVEHKED